MSVLNELSGPITREDIERLVDKFYDAVRADELLAPIFATKIGPNDWNHHIAHITEFWCSIFLKTGGFEGNPMRKHFALNGLTPTHFDRWLSLFQATATDVLEPQKAEAIYEMAQRIGQSFQMGLAFHYDNIGPKDHPFKPFGLRQR